MKLKGRLDGDTSLPGESVLHDDGRTLLGGAETLHLLHVFLEEPRQVLADRERGRRGRDELHVKIRPWRRDGRGGRHHVQVALRQDLYRGRRKVKAVQVEVIRNNLDRGRSFHFDRDSFRNYLN